MIAAYELQFMVQNSETNKMGNCPETAYLYVFRSQLISSSFSSLFCTLAGQRDGQTDTESTFQQILKGGKRWKYATFLNLRGFGFILKKPKGFELKLQKLERKADVENLGSERQMWRSWGAALLLSYNKGVVVI